MKNKLLTLFAVAIVCFVAYSGTGNEVYDPEKTLLIRTMAIDHLDDEVYISASAGTGTEESRVRMFSARGKSVSDAAYRLVNGTDNGNVELSHTEHIIIGEESAKTSAIPQVLDYVARSTDMRTDIKIYIAKGSTAHELLSSMVESGSPPADVLTELAKKADMLMTGHAYSCKDVSAVAMRHDAVAVMAIKHGENTPTSDGFGIIIGGKLSAFTDDTETKGMCIIENTAKSDSLSVDVLGKTATVSITDISCTVIPKIENGRLKISVTVCAEMGVTELDGYLDIEDANVRAELEGKAESAILASAVSAVEKSESLGADFLRLGERCRVMRPIGAKSGADMYESAPRADAVVIEVKTTLKRTYDTVDHGGGKA